MDEAMQNRHVCIRARNIGRVDGCVDETIITVV